MRPEGLFINRTGDLFGRTLEKAAPWAGDGSDDPQECVCVCVCMCVCVCVLTHRGQRSGGEGMVTGRYGSRSRKLPAYILSSHRKQSEGAGSGARLKKKKSRS